MLGSGKPGATGTVGVNARDTVSVAFCSDVPVIGLLACVRVSVWTVLAALALLAVFGLYTAPEFMVMLADQMWACF